jgi:hypothetical protein
MERPFPGISAKCGRAILILIFAYNQLGGQLGSDTVRPSDYGPSYVFELSRPIAWDPFFQILQSTFSRYERIAQDRPDEYRSITARSFERGTVPIRLDYREFEQDIPSRQCAIEHINTYLQNPQSWLARFYGWLANDKQLHYYSLTTFKGSRKYHTNAIEMGIFHGIIKSWIEYLDPLFVWGDDFPALKKHESEDSRFQVWGFNYYSRPLLDAIGQDRIVSATNEQPGWVLESLGNGWLLWGYPDPFQIPSVQKDIMRKALDLENKLAGVLNRKVCPVVVKENPPKGVVE